MGNFIRRTMDLGERSAGSNRHLAPGGGKMVPTWGGEGMVRQEMKKKKNRKTGRVRKNHEGK